LAEPKGNKKAKLVLKLKADESKLLSSIQVGITLAGFFSSASAAVSLSEGFAETLTKINIPFADTIALVIVTLILSYFTLVFGELFPKRIALRAPEKMAMILARPIAIIRTLFRPIVFVLSKSCDLLVKLFRIKPNTEDKVTEDEVLALIDSGIDDGTINSKEKELINAVFTFDNLNTKNVMTPRINMFMLNIDDSLSNIKKKIKEEKYTRIPVYEDNTDNIIGILNIKDIYFTLKYSYTIDDLRSILRKPFFVAESMKAEKLLKQLQANNEHCAIVIDEDGAVSGFITMEDLIEEITGNIYDEYDEKPTTITQISENVFEIDASLPIQDVNRALDLDIQVENDIYTTLAGYITYTLGDIPQVGIKIEFDDMIFTILEVINNRIIKVQIEKIIIDDEDEE
jgi:putative hemolysin